MARRLAPTVCLVVLAWQAAAGKRIALAANRDEFHARPTAPMDWWGAPPILAGRDLSAGGTWLGLDRRRRFAVITNFRGGSTPARAPSRGTLIPRFLAGSLAPLEFLAALAPEADRYAGFSLLLADEGSLGYFCNRAPEPPRLLSAGVYGLSNATLDAPWPKLLQSRAELTRRLGAAALSPDDLLEAVADRRLAADTDLPDTGVGVALERRLSPAFIVGADYGTRSSTALKLDADGRGVVLERSFGADGTPTGSRRFTLEPARS